MKEREKRKLSGEMRIVYERNYRNEKEAYKFKPMMFEDVPKGVESLSARMLRKGEVQKQKVRLFTK